MLIAGATSGSTSRPAAWAFDDPCWSSDVSLCYGELTTSGVYRLLHLLSLPASAPQCSLTASDVLYDIGSGFGRVAALLRESTNVSRVVGIEVNSCRARSAARLQGSHGGGGLSFVHGDVRKVGFDDATHLYLTSQCWPTALLRTIFGRLARRTPKLRCIIDVGSLDALVMQDLAEVASTFGEVRAIGRQVSGTWDVHAAAVLVVRPMHGAGVACNRSCVRRSRRWLEAVARDVEEVDLPGTPSPWRRPPPLIDVRHDASRNGRT